MAEADAGGGVAGVAENLGEGLHVLAQAAFVAERRIREACRRLALSADSIEQVAEAAGFANRHHFSRVFKRFAGCGPAEFRRGRGGI